MKAKKLSLALVFALLFALIATSCAAGKNYDAMDSAGAVYDSDVPSDPAEALEYGYDSGYDEVSDKYPTTDSTGGAVVDDAATMSEKIIRTVSIDAQTKEYDKAVGDIRAAVARLGGFEETFRSTGRNYYSSNLYSRNAYMVLRISDEAKFLSTLLVI